MGPFTYFLVKDTGRLPGTSCGCKHRGQGSWQAPPNLCLDQAWAPVSQSPVPLVWLTHFLPTVANYFSSSLSLSFLSYLFLVVLGLLCCMQALSNCGERGLPLVEVHRLLIVMPSLVMERRLWEHRLQQVQHVDSVITARRLSCPVAWGIFQVQGINPWPLPWQVNSYPLCHQRIPIYHLIS